MRFLNKREFQGTLTRATFFEIESIRDPTSTLAHKVPNVSDFKNYLKQHDVKPNDDILFYDDYGIIGAARSWFLFQVFGIKTQILNGGIKKWEEEGFQVETGPVSYVKRVVL